MPDATEEILAILTESLSAPAADMVERRALFSAAWRRVIPATPASPEPEPIEIPRGDGSVLRALLYKGESGHRPAVLYFHGGGLTSLSPEDYDAQSRMLSNMLGAVVLVPDFRLTPEHVFPAAWEDAQLAYRWLLKEGGALGVDAKRIVVMGDSGGGYLAASVPQEALRVGLPQPAGQVLIYPMLDMAGAAPSRYDRGDWVTDEGLNMITALYAGDFALDPRASPLREPRLEGLTAAFILTTDTDPLCDEGRAYALKLRRAGVPTTYFCYEGQTHGFLSFSSRIPEGAQALRHIVGWIEELIGTGK